jgi:hypothetical protein
VTAQTQTEERRSRRVYAAILAAGGLLASVSVPATPANGAEALLRLAALAAGLVVAHRLYGRSLRSRAERGRVEAVLLTAAVAGLVVLLVAVALTTARIAGGRLLDVV